MILGFCLPQYVRCCMVLKQISPSNFTLTLSGSGPHISWAWFHTSTTGLFAPVAPSTNSSLYRPIAIGSKKDDAADVARQASHILTLFKRSLLPRGDL